MLFVWLLFLGLLFRGLPKSLSSMRWTRVSGRIISVQKEIRQRNGKPVCMPIVSYDYSFEGAQYQSDRLTFLGTSGALGGAGFEWQVDRRLKRFAPNSSVDVFVNPNLPSEAVLLPGVHWSQYAGLVGISLFCLGVAFIVQILNFIWPGCQPNCR
jgi:hypothetical protein